MPFLTEEIWQLIEKRDSKNALIVASYPKAKQIDHQLIEEFELIKQVISNIRTLRKDKNIAFKNPIDLYCINNLQLDQRYNTVISKMGHIAQLKAVDTAIEGALTFRVKANEYFVPVGDSIDIEAELQKLQQELDYTQGFLKSVQKKLSNERFVTNAPEQVVASERQKEADALAKINTLKSSISALQ